MSQQNNYMESGPSKRSQIDSTHLRTVNGMHQDPRTWIGNINNADQMVNQNISGYAQHPLLNCSTITQQGPSLPLQPHGVFPTQASQRALALAQLRAPISPTSPSTMVQKPIFLQGLGSFGQNPYTVTSSGQVPHPLTSAGQVPLRHKLVDNTSLQGQPHHLISAISAGQHQSYQNFLDSYNNSTTPTFPSAPPVAPPKPQQPEQELLPQWAQCSKCKKWRVVMTDNVQTFKLPASWTCSQNTTNTSFATCDARQEIPSVENYSQTQLMALSYQRKQKYLAAQKALKRRNEEFRKAQVGF
jgi:hypothetical protein